MPVTLAQASLNAASAIDRNIIDEFRKSSFLLDRMPFDQSVNPAGGGSTLVYGYTRQITQRSAAFRAFNAEYAPVEVTKAQFTTNLRPLGGAFEIDRVLSDIGAISEVSFQLAQVIKASGTFWSDQVINGDSTVTPDGFDGLARALSQTVTHVVGPVLDLTAVNSQILALQAIQRINAWLGRMDGTPDALLMNATTRSWFSLIAALSGQLRSTTDAFGRPVETFRDIPLIDVGERAGSSALVIPTYGGVNEVQTITYSGTVSGGTMTLSYGGEVTAAVAHNVALAGLQAALEALPNIDPGDVVVTGVAGTNYIVTFGGRYAGARPLLIVVNSAALTGGGSAVVARTTPGGTGLGGLTDIYAVRFGLDGFHGVAVPGNLIRQWLPDFTTAGAVKRGEVEMGPVAVALKASRAAAAMGNIRVG